MHCKALVGADWMERHMAFRDIIFNSILMIALSFFIITIGFVMQLT